jgi:hypothetical protein
MQILEQARYDELIKREERLRILERTIARLDDYEKVKTLKIMIGKQKEGAVNNGKL